MNSETIQNNLNSEIRRFQFNSVTDFDYKFLLRLSYAFFAFLLSISPYSKISNTRHIITIGEF
jgi:hypothetical protein